MNMDNDDLAEAPHSGPLPKPKKRKPTARLGIRDDGRPRRGDGSRVKRPKRQTRRSTRRSRR
jgi:hypothetical protein